MATYEITSPDGRVFEITAPEGATKEQVLAYAKANMGSRPAPEPPVKPVEQGSFMDPVMQGLTFGWADELGGFGARIGQFAAGRPWDETSGTAETERQRARLSQYREDNPIAATLTELGSSLVSGGPLAKAARSGLGLIGIGAAGGGAYGAGAADENKLVGGAVGAGMGGLLSAAVPAVSYGLRRGWGAVSPTISDLIGRVRTDPTTRAGQVFADDLAAAGITPAQLRSRQRQLGPQATVAEVAGQPGIALGQGVIQKDPTGRARQMAAQSLGPRVPGISERVRGAVQDTTGVRTRLLDTLDEVKARQAANADAAYARVYAYDIAPDEELVRIMNRPSVKKAIPKAISGAKDEGRQLPALEKIVMQGDDFTVSEELIPDMRALDSIKQTLDDMVSAAYRRGDPEARAMRMARDALRNKLDKVNPEYAMARSLYAGDAAIEDALLQGEKILSAKTREVTQAVRGMGTSEREAFLKGAVEAIREKIGRARSGDMSGFAFLEKEGVLEKLRSVFPAGREGDRALAELRRRIAAERTLKQTYSDLLGGSQTAMRQAAGERIAGAAPTSAEVLMNPRSAGLSALANKFLGALGRERQATVDNLANILFQPGNVEEAIELLRQRGVPNQVIQQYVNRFSTGAVSLAPAVGGVSGSAMQ